MIFDFDGVLVDSECVATQQIADCADRARPSDQRRGGDDAIHGPALGRLPSARSSAEIGRPLPDDFHGAAPRRTSRRRLAEVAGGRGRRRLPRQPAADLPQGDRLVELDRVARAAARPARPRRHFGDRLFSAAEHVARGKPHPDSISTPPQRSASPIERMRCHRGSRRSASRPALAAGMTVIGLRRRPAIAGPAMPSGCARRRPPCRPRLSRSAEILENSSADAMASELVAAAVALGGEIGPVVRRWRRPCSGTCSTTPIPAASSAADLARIVGEQPDLALRQLSPASAPRPRSRARRRRSRAGDWRRPCRSPGPAAHRRAAC